MAEEVSRAPSDDAPFDMRDGGSSPNADVQSDASSDELGVMHDASLAAAFHDCSSFPAVDVVPSGPESRRSSFSYYSTAATTLIDTSESDSEVGPPSRCTSLSPSILPPDVEERRVMPSWPSSPAVSTAIADRPSSIWHVRKQLLVLHSKRSRISELLMFLRGGLFHRKINPVTEEAFWTLEEADRLMPKSKTNKVQQSGTLLLGVFRANRFKRLLSRLDNAIRNLSWALHSFGIMGDAIDLNGNGERLPPLALYDHNSFLIWSQLAKIYHASWKDKSRNVTALISLTFNNRIYVKDMLLWFKKVFAPLMLILDHDGNELLHCEWTKLLRSIMCDRWVVNDLVYGMPRHWHVSFQVQATIAYAISEFISNDPHSLYEYVGKGSTAVVVRHLISFYESRIRMPVKQQESHDISGLEEPFESEALIYEIAMATRALWSLAKGSPSNTRTIIASNLLSICLTRLTFLEDEPPESRLVSVNLLMEIANLGEKDASLRQFFSAVYKKDAKDICHQLRSISNNGGHNNDYSNMVLCIIAFRCLAKAFGTRELSHTIHFYEGWEIIATLLHILETIYSGIVTKKIGFMLSKDIPLRSLIHDSEITASELVLLCCITKYVVPAEFDDRVDIRALLEWASEERYLTKDATINRLILEAKSNLDQI